MGLIDVVAAAVHRSAIGVHVSPACCTYCSAAAAKRIGHNVKC